MLSMSGFLRGDRAPTASDGHDGLPSFRPLSSSGPHSSDTASGGHDGLPSFGPLPSSGPHTSDAATQTVSWAKIAVLLSASAFLAGIGIGSVATFVTMLHFTPNPVGVPHGRVSDLSQPNGSGFRTAGVGVATASLEPSPTRRRRLNIPH